MQERARAWRRAVYAAWGAAALALSMAGPAEARIETLRWSHSSPANVDGFRVHYGTSSGSYTTTLNVGLPNANNGSYSYNLTVADNATVYVALTAYGSGFLESNYSNEKRLAPTTTTPPPPPPPPTGASWSQDFQTNATGTYVPGWIDQNSSLAEDDSYFRVLDLSGNRVLANNSGGAHLHSHYISSGSSSWSAYELRGRMMISNTSGGIGVTVYSKYPQKDVYYVLRANNKTPFRVLEHGTTISCAPQDTGVLPGANVWYRFRFLVRPISGGNAIDAKVWRDGTTEPSAWQTSCTDTSSTRPTAGTVGVWSYGDGTKAWDDLVVLPSGGSATGPPPPPVLLPPQ